MGPDSSSIPQEALCGLPSVQQGAALSAASVTWPNDPASSSGLSQSWEDPDIPIWPAGHRPLSQCTRIPSIRELQSLGLTSYHPALFPVREKKTEVEPANYTNSYSSWVISSHYL